jgi:glycosyltransferase involved in cell wall biosynthesis
MNKLAVLVNVRDRPTEISLLLQSLRTQTFKDFDIFIMDDQSGTNMNSYHFFNCMVTRIKCEGHRIFMKRTEFPHGVSRARQAIVDWALNKGNYDYTLRVDDDVILEPEYIERLFKVIEKGYDIASGVTTPMTGPVFKRDPKYIRGIINRVILDKEGNYIMNGDDCGWKYTDSVILPAHHFRSCALIKKEVHDKVKYYPTRFSKHGFREEQIFSYKALMEGFKIGVDTGIVNYHQLTPSGGERFPEQNDLIKFNQKILLEFTKENKDKLNKIFTHDNIPDKLELMKENNLLMSEIK